MTLNYCWKGEQYLSASRPIIVEKNEILCNELLVVIRLRIVWSIYISLYISRVTICIYSIVILLKTLTIVIMLLSLFSKPYIVPSNSQQFGDVFGLVFDDWFNLYTTFQFVPPPCLENLLLQSILNSFTIFALISLQTRLTKLLAVFLFNFIT